MALNDETKNIIESTDIVELVSKYVNLEKAGKDYKGLCPFHDEKTPSFHVSPEKKICKCFGCGGGGTAVDFLMQIERISFPEAIQKLADFNGIKYEGLRPKKKDFNEKYYNIMQAASSFYVKYLENTTDGKEAISYLENRGLDKELIRIFGIGLSPNIGDTLFKVLRESNYLELDMTDVGLIDKNKNGYYDLFSNRIMFPIIDHKNHVIGFSARIFKSQNKDDPKYINSKETILFKKNEVLYNINNAIGYMGKRKRFILCEGQMDVIAAYKADLKEAICTMGTALTEKQAKLLSKYATHAVICYDGDKAGINASKKAIKIFKRLNMSVHLVLLPDGKDPDEYVSTYGAEGFKDYFENNMVDANQYLYTVATLNKNLSDSEVLNSVKNDVFEIIANTSSKIEKEDYINKFSQLLNTTKEAVLEDFDYYLSSVYIPETDDYIPVEPGYIQTDPNQYPDDYFPVDQVQPEYEKTSDINPPKKITKKGKWNNECEIRLFHYAKQSKNDAMFINGWLSGQESIIDALSFSSQSLWFALVDNYYNNFDFFNEGEFFRVLNEEQREYYVSICEELSKKKYEKFDVEDRNNCLLRLKEVKIENQSNKIKNEFMNAHPADKSRMVDEIFRLKNLNNQLKESRRKK